jgi:chromatin remodeling complex protein RSC6
LKKRKQVQQFEYQCPYQDIYEIAKTTPRQQQLAGEHCLSSRKTEAYDDEQTMIVVINLISVAHTIIRYHYHLSFSVPFRKKEKKKNNSRSRSAKQKKKKKNQSEKRSSRKECMRVVAGSKPQKKKEKRGRGKEKKFK